jgi:hypothetical protein
MSGPDQYGTHGSSETGDFDQAFINYDLGVPASSDRNTKISSANGNRSSRTVNTVGIRSSAKVIDVDADTTERDL